MPRLFGGFGTRSAAPMAADLDVLNFALGLEHLETALYRDAIATGKLQGRILQLFQQFGADEAAHVAAITDTIKQLGGTPVQAQAKYYMPEFATAGAMVAFFQQVEEVGAAAYLGAAGSITSKAILIAAVSIHNVEGQHAAILADFVGVSPSPVVAMPMSAAEVMKAIAPLLTAPAMPSSMPRTGEGGGYRTLQAANE